jgi:hypothetical protein
MEIMYYALAGIVTLIGVWVIGSYLVIRNIEEPTYTVLEKRDGYEVRQYDAYIVAETVVEGTYTDTLREGFRIIADYIFGNNTTKTSIAMTAPVLERSGEEIAMTVPVISTPTTEKARIISFVLPSSYTMETLPQPNDARVLLRQESAHKVAVRRFTWYATETNVEKQKDALVKKLLEDNVTTIGMPQVAQYNPPLSFPFTRRNEILVPIE